MAEGQAQVDGPEILASTLSRPSKPDRYGNSWQYHSRSDRHSKIACWVILFDALRNSALLRKHVAEGKVVFGVNQEMRDYRTNRTKDLDLVLATPGSNAPGKILTLDDLALKWGIRLTEGQRADLAGLPPVVGGSTGVVLVAMEAKAAMTAHIKALPRLFDELNSSHATVHANTNSALAVGFAMINASTRFLSTDINKWDLSERAAQYSEHRQPLWATRAVQKVEELPRRTSPGQEGFDAFGVVVVDAVNDGTEIRVVGAPPAPRSADVFHYDQMVRRLVTLYDVAYSGL